jgi:signal transduction histidine kinase/ligand-binding sensor domain-containing protein
VGLVCAAGAGRGWALDPGKRLTQYNRVVFDEAAGLPQSSVFAIAQSPDGYLWLGTGAGLARFDGVSFQVFGKANTAAIDYEQVRALLVDGEGALWIGLAGGNGLVRMLDGRFTSFAGRTGFDKPDAIAMLRDRAGALWFGGWLGVSRWQGGRFTALTRKDGLGMGSVNALGEDDRGAVWLGTAGGVTRFADGGFRAWPRRDLDVGAVTAVLPTGDGGLWIGGDRGLVRWTPDAGVTRRFGASGGLPHEAVSVLFRDGDGNVWVGTAAGLARLRDGGFETLPDAPGEPRLAVQTIFEDRERNLWVGTRAGGLLRLNEGAFTSFTGAEGLPGDRLSAVIEARDGAVWLGVDGVGLVRWHGGRARTFTPADGLCTPAIQAMLEDRDGRIWVGGSSGKTANLCRLEGERFRDFGFDTGLSPGAPVRALVQDRSGTIWIGSGQVYRIDDDRLRPEPFPEDVPTRNRNVFAIHEDAAGALWVGAGSGLYRRQGTQWTRYRPADGLSGNPTFAIEEDSDGTLWFGTIFGITRLRAGVFTGLRAEQGLFDDAVFQLLDGGDGALWLCTPRGVFRVDRRGLGDRGAPPPVVKRFGVSDGMKTNECQGVEGHGGAVRTRAGAMLFATIRGLASVDPRRLHQNRLPPPVVITRVLTDGRAADPGPRVVVAAGTRTLQVDYAALSLSAPEKVRFRYRLVPFEDRWVDAGGRRAAFYTNLRAGSYQFRVVASNNDGVWNETGATLAVTWRPALHQTVAFRTAAALALGLVAFGLYRLRLSQVKARHAAVLGERTRIAREMHDTLAQGFTGVSLHLEAAVKNLDGAPERARSNLDRARVLVRMGLGEARRAVWDLRPQSLEGGDLASALSELARKMSVEVPVRLRVTGATRSLAEAPTVALLRIAQESVTNATKHAQASEILVTLSYGSEAVALSVRDNGRGFEAGRDFGSAGHFGLVGMRERAQRVGATLVVRTARGEGTEIVVDLPWPAAAGQSGRQS